MNERPQLTGAHRSHDRSREATVGGGFRFQKQGPHLLHHSLPCGPDLACSRGPMFAKSAGLNRQKSLLLTKEKEKS